MEVRPEPLDRRARYALLTGMLVPRPIAWVSTVDRAGRGNLAPFSFFCGISATPPLLGISIGRRGGEKKDTWANLEATGEAVVHIPTEENAEAMVRSSGDYPAGVDEFELIGIAREPSTLVGPGRVREAAIAMECRLEQIVEVADDGNGFAILRILLIHLKDELLVDGRFAGDRLNAVGRLGGDSYCRLTDRFQISRPDTDAELRRVGFETRSKPGGGDRTG